MRKTGSTLMAVLGSAALVVAFLGARAAAAEGGATSCADCHQELATAFAAGTHGKAFAHVGEYASASCGSCHPGAERHAETGDAADVQTPREAGAEAANATCLACHANQRSRTLWPGSEHEAAGVACADCHSVHRARPARRGIEFATTTDLCLSCHAGHRKDLNLRSRHPLKEGKMDCASCHDPHGAVNEDLVRRDSINDLCWSCHQEKRGPFLWEHAPVREDCLTCHRPHGSNQERMLVARIQQLCQSCHIQGRHQAVAGTERAVWNTNRACLNCHSQVHGSNHPSGPLFQR